MANIRDIAKLTGYSVTTISRVINNHPYVDEKKRQKVLKVIDELNYTPNRTAQNLSYGKTHNLAVILPFVNHPFYSQLLNGILEAAFSRQYKVSLLPTNYDTKLEHQYLEDFAAKSFDGLIVTTRSNHLDDFIPYFQYGPIIFCEETPDGKAPYAAIDLKGSLSESLTYLKEQGIQRLGLTLGRSKRISRNSKLTIQLSREYFPEFDEKNIFWDCCIGEDGVKAAAFFEERGVDGIIAIGDEISAVLLQHWTSSKKPLIIGREDLLISEIMGFSTINHHLKDCGQAAFQLFYENSQEQIKIPYEFIPR